MGPTILLDKCALQALTSDEQYGLSKHFFLAIPPILIYEFLSDIDKYKDELKKFQGISQRLFAGDSEINDKHNKLCIASLLGYEVPLALKPVISRGEVLTADNGERGLFLEESLERKIIRGWQSGKISDAELELAKTFRYLSRSFDLERFRKHLLKHNQNIPITTDINQVAIAVHQNVSNPSFQRFYLAFLLSQFSASPNTITKVLHRWIRLGKPMISEFAPYAFHCLWVNLLFKFALAGGAVTPKPTNALDVEYLYYIPFCRVFSTSDAFLAKMAKCLLTPKQDFIAANDLKVDLKKLRDRWSTMSSEQQREDRYTLGNYPPLEPETGVHKLWVKHMGPYHKGWGDMRPNKERDAETMKRLRPIIDAIKR